MSSNNGFARPQSRAPSLKPTARLPLITPSASPPVFKPLVPVRSDGPSPTKKRRISSTPSSLSSVPRSGSAALASSSSSSFSPVSIRGIETAEDLHNARRASSAKVLSIWAQLEQKYARALDDDDIVDLRDVTLIKDRGVLKSSSGWEIGCFGNGVADEDSQPNTDVDDDIDELDAFSSRPGTPDVVEGEQLELARQQLRIPPVRVLDPADAEDLQEFLEMERLRREEAGESDEEEYEGVPHNEEGGRFDDKRAQEVEEAVSLDANSLPPDSCTSSTSSIPTYVDTLVPTKGDEDITSEDMNELDSIDVGDKTEDLSDEPVEGESEDELGEWAQDDGTVLYSVNDEGDSVDAEKEEVEIVEILSSPEPSVSPPKPVEKRVNRAQSLSRKRSKEPQARERPEIQEPQPPSLSTKLKRSLVPHVNLQLQTPPRSTSSRPENGDTSISDSRKENGVQKTRGLPRKQIKVKSRLNHLASSSKRRALTPSSKLVAEVVIERRSVPPEASVDHDDTVNKDSDVSHLFDDELDATTPVPTPIRKSSKGKEKMIIPNDEEVVSSSAVKVTPRSSSKGTSKSRNRKVDLSDSSSKDGPSISRVTQKRRRNTSDSNASDAAPEYKQTPSPPRQRNRRHSTPPSRKVPVSVPERTSSVYKSEDDESVAGPSSSSPIKQQPSSRRSRSRKRSSSAHRESSRIQESAYTVPQQQSFDYIEPLPIRGATPLHNVRAQTPGIFGNAIHDPNVQFYLAQALQGLTYLMGGSAPLSQYPPGFPQGQSVSPIEQHPDRWQPQMQMPFPPFIPYTPTHRHHSVQPWTPSSGATAPPTSSPMRSEVSSPGSSRSPSPPARRLSSSSSRVHHTPSHHRSRSRERDSGHSRHRSTSRSRSRPRSPAHSPPPRPRSALRGERSRERGGGSGRVKAKGLQRRVSFSEPEAVNIEDGEQWTKRGDREKEQDDDDDSESKEREYAQKRKWKKRERDYDRESEEEEEHEVVGDSEEEEQDDGRHSPNRLRHKSPADAQSRERRDRDNGQHLSRTPGRARTPGPPATRHGERNSSSSPTRGGFVMESSPDLDSPV